MENKRFSAISVIKDTFASAGKLYVPVFIIGLPNLIFSLIISTSNLEVVFMAMLNIAYGFLISPWVTGTTAFYSYQNLICFTLLIIPGFYLLCRRNKAKLGTN